MTRHCPFFLESALQQPYSNQLAAKEIERRRTFAIISHPDAGKTTLTEKLLLYGGAIQQAGAVKAKSHQKHTTSDWMEIERQRGISISSSVLQFEYKGYKINLLDTPGHKDFSEDTYRTLIAADAAVMLIDAAKGIEPQTRKLFEVCRLRGLPIFTFINKLDRPSRDPVELIDELESILGIRSCPMNWPIGTGDLFKGIYDRQTREVHFFHKGEVGNVKTRLAAQKVKDIRDPQFLEFIGSPGDDLAEKKRLHQEMIEQVDLLEIAGDPLDQARVLAGQLTPVFFGSAMNNFGVELFLQYFLTMAPPPTARQSDRGLVEPTDPSFSGLIFKIQSNMDPQHRNRVAFMRIVSGKFERGMDAVHARTKKRVRISRAFNFFAQDKETVEEAWPGDVVGILDTSGDVRIGDTLCTGTPVMFETMTSFAPEHFASVSTSDPMKRKQLAMALKAFTEEGVVQMYHSPKMVAPVLGAVGVLQFEIFTQRIKSEYNVEARLETLSYACARWVKGAPDAIAGLSDLSDVTLVADRDENPVALFRSDWALRRAGEKIKGLEFLISPPPLKVASA
jgi:peptide chain release factor 3